MLGVTRAPPVSSLLALGILVAAHPAPASAQAPDVRLHAKAGVTGAVGEVGRNLTGVPSASTETDVEPGSAVGGGVELSLPGTRFAVRGEVLASPGASMVTERFLCAGTSPDPHPDTCRARSTGTVLTGVADLVYRTDVGEGGPYAYFALGGGFQRLDFSREPSMEEAGGGEVHSGSCRAGDLVCDRHVGAYAGARTQAAGRVSAGLGVQLPGVRLFGEISDVVSVFRERETGSERLQQIVGLYAGAAFRL